MTAFVTSVFLFRSRCLICNGHRDYWETDGNLGILIICFEKESIAHF